MLFFPGPRIKIHTRIANNVTWAETPSLKKKKLEERTSNAMVETSRVLKPKISISPTTISIAPVEKTHIASDTGMADPR